MRKVLFLGATGSIARVATHLFLDETDAQLTLYVRNARRLGSITNDRVRVIEGNALDAHKLTEAMAGQTSSTPISPVICRAWPVRS